MKLKEALIRESCRCEIIWAPCLIRGPLLWTAKIRKLRDEAIIGEGNAETFAGALQDAMRSAQIAGFLPEPIDLSGFAADELGV